MKSSQLLRAAPLTLPLMALFGCSATERFSRPKTSRLPVLVETTMCSVSLTKLSYDDPGADDAEFVEMSVRVFPASGEEGTAPPGGGSQSPSCAEDAAAAHEDAAVADGVRRLADCGLGSLELINGATDECAVYRTLDLSEVPVPEDGFVTLCSDESQHAADCTPLSGAARLRNSWLQNGPADGLRFIAVDGTVLGEFGYEGASPGCFQTSPIALRDEAGEISGAAAPEDDVNVWCGDAFQIQPLSAAGLHSPNQCDAPEPSDAGEDAATERAPQGAGDTPPAGDASEAGEPSHASVGINAAPPAGPKAPQLNLRGDADLPAFDAGSSSELAANATPAAPGCGVAPGAGFRAAPLLAWALLLAGCRRRLS